VLIAARTALSKTTIWTRLGLIDTQCPAAESNAIHCAHCRIRSRIVHLYKSKSPRPTRFPVHDQRYVDHLAVRSKCFAHGLFRCVKRKIPDIQPFGHLQRSLSLAPFKMLIFCHFLTAN
jgi:hypothetical protein